MREIGALEAKNKLGQLLDLVERGKEIVIKRHGKEVARLVPPQRAFNSGNLTATKAAHEAGTSLVLERLTRRDAKRIR
jgi:prevent-host-death family protein